jgi:hypothetical protein
MGNDGNDDGYGMTANKVDDDGDGATWRRRRRSYEISVRPREKF